MKLPKNPDSHQNRLPPRVRILSPAVYIQYIIKGEYVGSEDYEPINLGMKKRIAVRKYKGHILVDIREMYEKDGEERPGRKGISLNLPQYIILKVR